LIWDEWASESNREFGINKYIFGVSTWKYLSMFVLPVNLRMGLLLLTGRGRVMGCHLLPCPLLPALQLQFQVHATSAGGRWSPEDAAAAAHERPGMGAGYPAIRLRLRLRRVDIQRGPAEAEALRIAGICPRPLAVTLATAPRTFVRRGATAPLAARQPLGPFFVELLAHPGYHLGSAARCSPVSLHFAALFHG